MHAKLARDIRQRLRLRHGLIVGAASIILKPAKSASLIQRLRIAKQKAVGASAPNEKPKLAAADSRRRQRPHLRPPAVDCGAASTAKSSQSPRGGGKQGGGG